MKKLILIIFILPLYCFLAKAQTEAPAITELHALLNGAKNNFSDDIGKKIKDDPAMGNIYYETKKTTAMAETEIMHKASGQNIYMIIYDAKGDNAVKAMPVVDLYINELNKMVKTGNYTVADGKDNAGKDVTDIKDKDGNIALRYASNTTSQIIYLYGYTDHKK